MKILLDIPDSKASSFMEVLKSIRNVKVTQVTDKKAQLIGEIRKAVEEIKLIRAGKKKARKCRRVPQAFMSILYNSFTKVIPTAYLISDSFSIRLMYKYVRSSLPPKSMSSCSLRSLYWCGASRPT